MSHDSLYVQRVVPRFAQFPVDSFTPQQPAQADSVFAQWHNLYEAMYNPACGNGNKTILEQCDDGNLDPGDGCSSICQIEVGWKCTNVQALGFTDGFGSNAGSSECSERRGDNLLVGGELCDDREGVSCDQRFPGIIYKCPREEKVISLYSLAMFETEVLVELSCECIHMRIYIYTYCH